MIWIVTFALFFYLVYRLNELEHKLQKLNREEIKNTVQAYHETFAAQQPKPEPEKPHAQPKLAEEPKIFPDMAQKPAADHDWEVNLGGKFFTIIGSVAVLFGLGFFLKYAFDHNLIPPAARVFLGLILGGIFVGLGQYTKKKYILYGNLLAGLGLGVFYLSIYASFSLYHLVTQPVAFGGMILVTILGTLLAIRDNSEAMAGLAQFGGFITPLLLSSGGNHPHTLFGYLIVLDIGILIISYIKPWQTLSVLSLIGTALIYAGWFGTVYTTNQFTIAFGYVTAFFVVYLAANLIQYFRHRIADEKTLLLLNLNAVAYFGFGYLLMNHLHHSWLAPFAFVLGILYVVISLVAYQNRQGNDHYGDFNLAIGCMLFFIAIPLQFHRFVISVAWGAEALVLILLGFKIRAQFIRYLGHAFFVLATIYTLSLGWHHESSLWLSLRLITSILISGTLAWSLYIYWTKKSETNSVQTGGAFAPTNEYQLAISVLGLQAYILLVWGISKEIMDGGTEHWLLPVIWTWAALIVGWLGVKIRNEFFRFIAYATLIVVALRLLFAEENVNLATYSPVLNTRVLAFLSVFALTAYLVHLLKKSDSTTQTEKDAVIPTIFFANNILLLWIISLEVLDFYNQKTILTHVGYGNAKDVALSVTWILYAVGNLILGIVTKRQSTRIFAIILFMISIIKVFLYDTVSLNNLERFISYITLGVILLFSGYLYNRYKERIIEFLKAK